jgi:hypothetical protein
MQRSEGRDAAGPMIRTGIAVEREGSSMRRTRIGLAVVCAIVGTLEATSVEAAITRNFGAVRASCDDDRTCVAALTARDTDGAVLSVVQISRTPEPRSRWTIAVSTLANLADKDRPVSFAVDGGISITLRPPSDFAPFVEPSTFYVLSQPALDRLMSDLTVGTTLRFTYIDIAGVSHTDRYGLDGVRAALVEIDRQQGRIVGDRRAGPPPPDLPPAPEVDEAAVIALDGVPPRLLDWHLAASVCETPESPSLSGVDPVIAPLSDTAMLYALPCFVRDGRPNHRLYLIESGEIGGMHALYFATWSARFGWSGTDTLEAIAYDPATRRLTATDLGGVEGCGWAGEWTFDAYAFRLDALRAEEDCDAGTDPSTWPAVFSR